MNRQNVQKLQLLLSGLQQRLEDNYDDFRKLTVKYKAGTREFNANISLEGKQVKVYFLGKSENVSLSGLAGIIAKYAENYDSVQALYEERGTNILIEGDNRNVKMQYLDPSKEETVRPHNENPHVGNREFLIKVGSADAVLKEIGILSEEGKVRNDMVRKYNQIDHFVELIQDMLKDMQDVPSINVLDCGCGKSYLTFVLNYYIKEVLKRPCHFIGLDYSDIVIDASKRMAGNLGYANMEFHKTDIRSYRADRDIHMVISLHACDTATDDALALGIRNNVRSIVAVPCCHRELLSQYKFPELSPVLKHGVFKARMADILTDGMRSLFLEAMGYKVSVIEYISPLETPKNLMIRAVKDSTVNNKAREEYNELKEMLKVEPTLEKLIYDK